MKSFSSRIKLAGLALAVVSSVATATITFDSTTGIGFVGKGDVQYTFGGMNNAWAQSVSPFVRFRATSTVVAEQTWECHRFVPGNGNEIIHERTVTTTTASEGVVTTIARLKNQFTGFILAGWDGSVTTSTETDGPALNSCPAAPQNGTPFELLTPAGDAVVISEAEALEVSADAGLTWRPALQAPTL